MELENVENAKAEEALRDELIQSPVLTSEETKAQRGM